MWFLDVEQKPSPSFAASLPPWATATQYDPAVPVEVQVGPNTRVIIPATGPPTIIARAVSASPRLALITQPASGLDNVDVAAATARRIPVCAAPGVNAASVAEAAIMSLLCVARRLDDARAALRARSLGEPLGTQLAGKTLVIVGGSGAIGSRVAAIATAMGMEVTCLSSSSTRADVTTALAAADAVSVHCPLTPATRHLFDAGAFAALKHGALFINYSRGGVVDEAALLNALDSGRVAVAGLDVFSCEPVDPASPLAAHPRVLATPHIGVSTHEVWAAYRELLVGNVVAARSGGALRGQVNEF